MLNRRKENTTIIKRSARRNHNAIHGGAWKVAFADFTLAMMALFMVLWIMGAVTEQERKEIVALLNSDSIFEGSSLSPVTQPTDSGGNIAVAQKRDNADKKQLNDVAKKRGEIEKLAKQEMKGKSLEDVNRRSRREIEELARIILKITSAYNAQSNMKIEIVPQGLRILIQDDRNREMYQRSSAILTPFFKTLLTEFAKALNSIDNKIIITGHTDATQFRDQMLYNNWNLSGERAMQARRVLTSGGLEPQKILQVSGMADQMLLDKNNPLSAANRRIEIMVLTHAASDSLYHFFGQHGEKIIQPLLEKSIQK